MRVTVDLVIFSIGPGRQLQALLIERKYPPFEGNWALPGGFVLPEESLEEAARRELEEETGVTDVYLEQLFTFGDVGRDPRGRVITVAWFALIAADRRLHATTDASRAAWFSVSELP
ncbi:MAG: NUDIX domain-containing protein, partial [Candidatus Xenobia bacterium]